MRIARVLSIAAIVAGTAIAPIGPVMADSVLPGTYDGDLVEVVTDKPTYWTTESIRVMAKFSNVRNADLFLGYPGMPTVLDVQLYVIPIPANGSFAYSGSLPQLNPTSSGGVVAYHSGVVAAMGTIPAGRLARGLYEVDLLFKIKSGSTILFQAHPLTVIQVQ